MITPQWEACKVCGGDHWTKDHLTDATGPCETCGLYHDHRDGAQADPMRSLRHSPHLHCAATIATLRAALDGLIAVADKAHDKRYAHRDCELCAAVAKAKEINAK